MRMRRPLSKTTVALFSQASASRLTSATCPSESVTPERSRLSANLDVLGSPSRQMNLPSTSPQATYSSRNSPVDREGVEQFVRYDDPAPAHRRKPPERYAVTEVVQALAGARACVRA